MKLLGKTAIRSLLALTLLAPSITFAAPIVYSITSGGGGGFSASWLHSADNDVYNTDGYWMNGDYTASLSGALTIDWDTGDASGSITTAGDFGQDAGAWELVVTGGTNTGPGFFGGDALLLALDYELYLDGAGTSYDAGTFYFADRNFAGSANSGSASSSEIFLWGNNWLNENGNGENPDCFTTDRECHKEFGGTALGIDLYGISSVPEPASLFMLGAGLFGLSLRRRRKTA